MQQLQLVRHFMFVLNPHHLLPQPHIHVCTTLSHRDNYCTNVDHTSGAPGCMQDRPWCYTLDVNVPWEYCDIPNCGKLFGSREINLIFHHSKKVYSLIIQDYTLHEDIANNVSMFNVMFIAKTTHLTN